MERGKEEQADVTDYGNFAYYYAGEGEQYVFYRVPKVLFTDDRYRKLSTDAKMLYGLMLDRMALSEKNRWNDDNGRLYIYFTVDDIQESLGVARQKASLMLSELEKGGLILRERRGLGRPNRIYVGRFLSSPGVTAREERHLPDNLGSNFKKYENQTSGSMEIKLQEVRKSNSNNTNKSNTDLNKIYSINQEPGTPDETMHGAGVMLPSEPYPDYPNQGKEMDKMDAMEKRAAYQAFFDEQCGFDSLQSEFPGSDEELQGIRDLLVDVCLSRAEMIRISGEDKPAALVRAQLMKLNIEHIRYVLGCLAENTTRVANPKAYLLASLYNAPLTMGTYYRSRVNHDLYGP